MESVDTPPAPVALVVALAVFTFVTAVRYGVSGAPPWQPSPRDRVDDGAVVPAYAAWLDGFTRSVTTRNPDELRADDGVSELLLRKAPPVGYRAGVDGAQSALDGWIGQLAAAGLALPEYALRDKFRYEGYASLRRRVPGQRYAADTALGGLMGTGDNVPAAMCLMIGAAACFFVANAVAATASLPCVAAYVLAIVSWGIATVR